MERLIKIFNHFAEHEAKGNSPLHVANQFTEEIKQDLTALLYDLSMQSSVYHVYNNMYDRDLHVDCIALGETTSLKILKNTDGHGKSFVWMNE